jgi:hypothetical protein
MGSPILTAVFESNNMALSLVETGCFVQERIKKERAGIKNNRDLILFINSYLAHQFGHNSDYRLMITDIDAKGLLYI